MLAFLLMNAPNIANSDSECKEAKVLFRHFDVAAH